MTSVVHSIAAEFRRYRALAEAAMAQLDDGQLFARDSGPDNSIAVIVRHLGGNLASRFTDFLTADGEKPWRDRDAEFLATVESRTELIARWARGWDTLFDALTTIGPSDLTRTVTIRGTPLTVTEALHRSLAHASYHVGQIVFVAKALKGHDWQYLSIPPGQSARYNQAPGHERADAHATSLFEVEPHAFGFKPGVDPDLRS